MKKWFTGLVVFGLILVAGDVVTERVQRIEAATPLPSGCYTDSSGLAVCGPNYPGPGGTPGPQATPTGGNCIAVSTPPAAGSIAYSCASPTAAPTPSPSATSTSTTGPPACTWSSSWPYQLNCSFPAAGAAQVTPSPAATSTSTAGPPSCVWSGSFPYQLNCNFPAAGSSYTPAPGSTPNYDAVILAETHATHYWEFNDGTAAGAATTPGPCATSATDSISGGATALPSPVALPMPTTAPYCNAVGILKDGERSVQFDSSTSQYFQVPSAVFQTLCNVSGGTCNLPFSIECIMDAAPVPATGTFHFLWALDNTTPGSAAIYVKTFQSGTVAPLTAALTTKLANSTELGFSSYSAGTPLDVVYEFDGATKSSYYVNGSFVLSTTANSPAKANGLTGDIGGGSSGSVFNGRVQKCSTYNVALTAQQIWAHFQATGLR